MEHGFCEIIAKKLQISSKYHMKKHKFSQKITEKCTFLLKDYWGEKENRAKGLQRKWKNFIEELQKIIPSKDLKRNA